MRRVAAVDPGGVTGFVLVDEQWTMAPGELPWEAAQDVLWAFAEQAPTTFVVEKYTITRETLKKSRQYEALYVIGGVLLMARRLGGSVVVQTPADAKTLATDALLKSLDWWHPTPDGHTNDAMRHYVLWAANNGELDPRRLLPDV